MRDVIYLNHAGTSWPKPNRVVQAVHDAMACCPSQWPDRFDAAHHAICEAFGVRNSEQLLLTPGCTSALHTAIANVSLPVGGRVLTSCWEHHALNAPLRNLADGGFAVDQIPPTDDACFDLDRFEQSLKTGNVSLVAFTAACNVTGDLLPVQEIVELSRRFGAMTLIDAAQTAGWIKLDLEKLGADFVAFGGHKALQAPWGIGALFIADSAKMQCVSATCELPNRKNSDGKPNDAQPASPRPGYCDVGSVDQFALAGANRTANHSSQTRIRRDQRHRRSQYASTGHCHIR